MSGGGGSIPTTQDYINDSHALIVRGGGTTIAEDWDTPAAVLNVNGDYKDNPSILRFILERGQSDAGGNPYDGVSAYEGEDDLDQVQERFEEFRDTVLALDPENDLVDYNSTARTEANTDVPNIDVDTLMDVVLNSARHYTTTMIYEALELAAEADRDAIVRKALAGFRTRAREENLKSVNRFTGPMGEINAINSSAFIFGMAMLEKDYQDSMTRFDAEFTLPLTRQAFEAFVNAYLNTAQPYVQVALETRRLRATYIMQTAQQISQMMSSKMDLDKTATIIQGETAKTKIVSLSEEYEKNLEYDVKNAGWDMELFQQAANVLSAVNGAVVPQAGKPSRLQSALSGAFSGAAIGTGSGVPGIGTAIGAVAGGIGGLIAGG